MRWTTAWKLAKDIGLTGTGLFVIVLQAFSPHPSGLLLGTGLALTVPSTWDHINALLPSSGGSSSDSSQPDGSPRSSSQEGDGSGE